MVRQMKKIKTFNVVITLAAFAAMYFLLPNDQEISNVTINRIGASAPTQPSITQKAFEHPTIKSAYLHST